MWQETGQIRIPHFLFFTKFHVCKEMWKKVEATKEQAFLSPEPPGPLNRQRLGTRARRLWGYWITEVLDSRTSGFVHVCSLEMSLNYKRKTWRLPEAVRYWRMFCVSLIWNQSLFVSNRWMQSKLWLKKGEMCCLSCRQALTNPWYSTFCPLLWTSGWIHLIPKWLPFLLIFCLHSN